MKVLTFFNSQGGVGKTTLLFNVAHMLVNKGKRVTMVDCDPQCNLSASILDDEKLDELWSAEGGTGVTVENCLRGIHQRTGDICEPRCITVSSAGLSLLPGDLLLSQLEQTLAADGWGRDFRRDKAAILVASSVARVVERAGAVTSADIVLLDVGPSLGALNRAVHAACDAVVVPVAPDLFSLRGLQNVGPTLRDWNEQWKEVRPPAGKHVPPHQGTVLGYVVQQHLARADRPVAGYHAWADRIPDSFARFVQGRVDVDPTVTIQTDPLCLGLLKHYASLVPLAQAARKPIFALKQADGIGGGQIQSVAHARKQFSAFTDTLLERLQA
ncbi:ParA family protein [Pendulispora albinea]|uniref:AAA family ATPase n=1 Tax=Pendulispora albinea TaxID=2741071 RepID=A0ABZ2LLU0_9BACT